MYTVFIAKRIRQVKDSLQYGASLGGPLYTAGSSIRSNKYIIRLRISPGLLARVPEDLWQSAQDVETIYTGLKKLCGLFRFMELPAELRVKIYEEVVRDGEERDRNKNKPWTVTPSYRLPALAQISRQLRQEVLPIYFTTTNFHINIDRNARYAHLDENHYGAIRSLVLRWNHDFVDRSAIHLRHVTLYLSAIEHKPTVLRFPLTAVELWFSKTKGYSVSYDKALSPRSKEKLTKHMDSVSARRNRSHLNGESIMVAFVEEVYT